MEKFITIKNRCLVLTSRGQCIGPTNVPFKEDTMYIFNMLCGDADIHEVFRDGSSVKLNIYNYDKDNTPAVKPVEVITKPNPAKFIDNTPKVVEVTEEVEVEEVSEEVEVVETEEEVTEEQPKQEYHNNKKKGKNKNKHQNQVITPVEEA